MKRKTITFIAVAAILVAILSVAAAAASFPNLSSSSYCEFSAAGQINVYKNSSCTTRGTSNPSSSYNAYIAKNDVCHIYKINSSYAQVSYPTSSGRKTGYIKTADLLGASVNPNNALIAGGKVTTYKYKGGSTTGYYESGDTVYNIGGKNYNVMYTAKSGKRAYKLAYATNGTQKPTPVSSTLRFPLKGSITRSSSVKTNGIYCDYRTGGSVGVYAPANGTVVYKQAYRNRSGGRMLSSYGNYIEFTSSDGVYKIKCCHLSSFNGVGTSVKTSLSYPCSGSDGTVTLATRTVKQGELLGYSGMTGNASGHHLHLEVYKNGKAVNPATVFTTW